jgi:hypothetical protein
MCNVTDLGLSAVLKQRVCICVPLEAWMYVLVFSVFCCIVYVGALRWADPPPKESYQMYKRDRKSVRKFSRKAKAPSGLDSLHRSNNSKFISAINEYQDQWDMHSNK